MNTTELDEVRAQLATLDHQLNSAIKANFESRAEVAEMKSQRDRAEGHAKTAIEAAHEGHLEIVELRRVLQTVRESGVSTLEPRRVVDIVVAMCFETLSRSTVAGPLIDAIGETWDALVLIRDRQPQKRSVKEVAALIEPWVQK